MSHRFTIADRGHTNGSVSVIVKRKLALLIQIAKKLTRRQDNTHQNLQFTINENSCERRKSELRMPKGMVLYCQTIT